jgi:predicted DCC family thiol-disulfide oxidoreductase YuxK
LSSAAEHDHPVILFDGVCNLCTGSVRFVIERDSRKRFRFASLQSPVAERLLGRREDLESVILLQDGKTYRKSGAALRIARRLDGLWPLLAVLLIIPGFLRDAVYDWIGRRRYRMFGRREACWLPSVDLADRFLNSGTQP